MRPWRNLDRAKLSAGELVVYTLVDRRTLHWENPGYWFGSSPFPLPLPSADRMRKGKGELPRWLA
jgi:hypothetical protein